MPSDTPLAEMSDEELRTEDDRRWLEATDDTGFQAWLDVVDERTERFERAELSRRERRSATSTTDGEQS